MMTLEKFAEAVSSEVAKRLGAGFHVHVLKPVINNGIVQTQLCIEKEGQQFRPSIHLKDFFECYKKGTGLQAIIDEILECYASAPDIPAGMQEIVNDMSFEKIKDKIMCKLVNTHDNASMRENIPNIPYLDLSVIFLLLCEETEEIAATLMITNKHLNYWSVDKEELYQRALVNMVNKYPPVLMKITDMMYVLTNRIHFCGAEVLLYPGLMRYCELHVGKDFLIIPYSVDEVILFPTLGVEDAVVSQELADLIQSINAEEVPADERLSNHAYRYCVRRRKFHCLFPAWCDLQEWCNGGLQCFHKGYSVAMHHGCVRLLSQQHHHPDRRGSFQLRNYGSFQDQYRRYCDRGPLHRDCERYRHHTYKGEQSRRDFHGF